jgi:hypothetical protein
MSGVPGYLFFGSCFAIVAAIQARSYRREGGWSSLAAAWAAGLLSVAQVVAMLLHLNR